MEIEQSVIDDLASRLGHEFLLDLSHYFDICVLGQVLNVISLVELQVGVNLVENYYFAPVLLGQDSVH